MIPAFLGNVTNIDLDRLLGIVPVSYILLIIDSILLIQISSSASKISTEMLSGPVAIPYFILLI